MTWEQFYLAHGVWKLVVAWWWWGFCSILAVGNRVAVAPLLSTPDSAALFWPVLLNGLYYRLSCSGQGQSITVHPQCWDKEAVLTTGLLGTPGI